MRMTLRGTMFWVLAVVACGGEADRVEATQGAGALLQEYVNCWAFHDDGFTVTISGEDDELVGQMDVVLEEGRPVSGQALWKESELVFEVDGDVLLVSRDGAETERLVSSLDRWRAEDGSADPQILEAIEVVFWLSREAQRLERGNF